MLNVQKYIQENSLKNLEEEYGIIVTKYNDRIVLNYSQISSPKFNPICDECRGLILSWPDLRILSWPFNRFYNYGEGGWGENFNIINSTIYEKIDGSLINFYFDGNDWCCSTRRKAFAEGSTKSGKVFNEIVKIAKSNWKEKLQNNVVAKNYTIICELISPETRIVVPYKEYKLYLLAIRDLKHGDFLNHEELKSLSIYLQMDIPKNYKFNNFNEIIESSKNLDPMSENGEGFVCVENVTQYRVKIKNPSYLAISHLRESGAIHNKRIAELVINNDEQEYLSYFPEDREFFEPYIQARERMYNDIYETYNKYKNLESQKEFALNVKDKIISPILFSMRKGNKIDDIISNLYNNCKIRIIEKYT